MDKSKVVLTLAAPLLFLMFIGNFSYGFLKEKGPLKIAILDTGISNIGYKNMCKDGHKSFTAGGRLKDVHPRLHGSNIAAIIEREAGPGNWCFIVIKYTEGPESSMSDYLNALKYVSELNISIVNLSLEGRSYSEKESTYIQKLLKNKVTIVSSAGNDGEYIPKNACNVYPACLDPRIFVAGNSGSRTSNRGPFVDTYINGQDVQGAGVSLSGTSQSAAIFTGRIIKEALKGY